MREIGPAIFFDRDGVLVEDAQPTLRPDQVRLLPGAARAVRAVNDVGLPALVVTNQAVMARGLLTEAGLAAIHRRLEEALWEEAGAHLDGFYLCPHHPAPSDPTRVEALCVACDCRKPAPGLFLRAAREREIDLARSFMIGDKTTDILAAQRAGVRAILLTHSGECGLDGRCAATPDFSASAAAEAVALALDILAREADIGIESRPVRSSSQKRSEP